VIKFTDYLKKQNRTLAFPFFSNIGVRLTGYRMIEIFSSPEKQLEIVNILDDMFDPDFISPINRVTGLVESLGLSTERPDYDFFTILEGGISSPAALARLEIPDPLTNPILAESLSALELISHKFKKPVVEWIRGPFTQAATMVGIEDFLRATIKQPQFVEDLLDFTVEMVVTYANAAAKTGIGMLFFSEPIAVTVSPRQFERLVMTRFRQVLKRINNKDIWFGLHICGDTSKLLDYMLDCTANAISLDQQVDLSWAATKVPKDKVIFGNLDPMVLAYSTPEVIRDTVEKLGREMADYPNYLFAFGCDCLPDTPFENLRTAIEAGKRPRINLLDIKGS
jgi:uroporphyrinogen decarboxylase